MITCPVNDWTCPFFDSEGKGKCKINAQGNEHLSCEFLSSPSYDGGILNLVLNAAERGGTATNGRTTA